MKKATFILLLLISGCSENRTKSVHLESEEKINQHPTEPVYELISTELPGNGFGYQILKDGQLMIEQQQIPAIQGIRYFSSEADALKTGELALKKIKDHLFPPTISVEELDSLGVL
ncbi:MAG: DUF4907 domain-containing protein [Cryomorphaceae bacterium]|jgi:hypothetical protein|nr:DUF4907 domain-containing protein [Cryomorphaceae bacterium]